jgi:hypothetical protein|tara:strand:- start:11214 stop:11402 length:189 start_codon:yes stop_codon:yes gene_type:complete
MLSKFIVIVWLSYNYENPVIIGSVEDCDTGKKIAEQLQPNHKAFGCFTEEHWNKQKFAILNW